MILYILKASPECTSTLYSSRSTRHLKALALFHPLQLLFPSTLTYFSVDCVGGRTFPHACSTDFVERGSNHGSLFGVCSSGPSPECSSLSGRTCRGIQIFGHRVGSSAFIAGILKRFLQEGRAERRQEGRKEGRNGVSSFVRTTFTTIDS